MQSTAYALYLLSIHSVYAEVLRRVDVSPSAPFHTLAQLDSAGAVFAPSDTQAALATPSLRSAQQPIVQTPTHATPPPSLSSQLLNTPVSSLSSSIQPFTTNSFSPVRQQSTPPGQPSSSISTAQHGGLVGGLLGGVGSAVGGVVGGVTSLVGGLAGDEHPKSTQQQLPPVRPAETTISTPIPGSPSNLQTSSGSLGPSSPQATHTLTSITITPSVPAAPSAATTKKPDGLIDGLLNGVGSAVGGAVNGAETIVGGAINGAESAVSNAVEGAKTILSDAFNGIHPQTTHEITSAPLSTPTRPPLPPTTPKPSSQPPKDPLGGLLGGAGSLVGGVVGGAESVVGGVVGGAESVVGGVVGGAASVVGGVVGGAGSVVGGVLGQSQAPKSQPQSTPTAPPGPPLTSSQTPKAPPSSSTNRPGLIGGLFGGVESVVGGVVGDGASIVGGVVSVATSIVDGIIPSGIPVVGPVVSDVNSVVGGIVGDVTSIAEHILPPPTPQPTLPPTPATRPQASSPVVTTSKDSGLVGGLFGGVNSLVGGVVGGAETIVGDLLPTNAPVLGPINSVIGGVVGGAGSAVGGVLTGAESVIGGVVGGAESVVNGIVATPLLPIPIASKVNSVAGGVVGGAESLVGDILPTQAPTTRPPSPTEKPGIIPDIVSDVNSVVNGLLPSPSGPPVLSNLGTVHSILSDIAVVPAQIQQSILPSAESVLNSIIAGNTATSSSRAVPLGPPTVSVTQSPSTVLPVPSTLATSVSLPSPSPSPKAASVLSTWIGSNSFQIAVAKTASSSHAASASVSRAIIDAIASIPLSSSTVAASSSPTPQPSLSTSMFSSLAPSKPSSLPTLTFATSQALSSDSASNTLAPLSVPPLSSSPAESDAGGIVSTDPAPAPTPYSPPPFVDPTTVNTTSATPSPSATPPDTSSSPPAAQKNAAIGVGVALPSAALIAVAAVAYFARRRHSTSASIFGSGSIDKDEPKDGTSWDDRGSTPTMGLADGSSTSLTTPYDAVQRSNNASPYLGLSRSMTSAATATRGNPSSAAVQSTGSLPHVLLDTSSGTSGSQSFSTQPSSVSTGAGGLAQHRSQCSKSHLVPPGLNLSAINSGQSRDGQTDGNHQNPFVDPDPPTPFSGARLSLLDDLAESNPFGTDRTSPSERDLEIGVPVDIRPHTNLYEMPIQGSSQGGGQPSGQNPYTLSRLQSLKHSRPITQEISPADEVTGMWAEDERVRGALRDSWERSTPVKDTYGPLEEAPKEAPPPPIPPRSPDRIQSTNGGDWLDAWGSTERGIPPLPAAVYRPPPPAPRNPFADPMRPPPRMPLRGGMGPRGAPRGRGGMGMPPGRPRGPPPPGAFLRGPPPARGRGGPAARGGPPRAGPPAHANAYPPRGASRPTQPPPHPAQAALRSRSNTASTEGTVLSSLTRSNTLHSKYSTRRFSDDMSMLAPPGRARQGSLRPQLSVDQLIGALRDEPGTRYFSRESTFE